MTSDMVAGRLIRGAISGLGVATAFFFAFPGTDLAVSHLFGSAAGFPVAHDRF